MANELHQRVKSAYPSAKVAVYRGSITAGARRAAGIDSRVNLLGERGRKDRLDRRHHAVDAAVIAMMSPGIAKTLAERSNLRWSEWLSGKVETWKSFTGATPGARENFGPGVSICFDLLSCLISRSQRTGFMLPRTCGCDSGVGTPTTRPCVL